MRDREDFPVTTDKIELGYGPTYEALAEEFIMTRILEVGVAGGAGLDYFRRTFQTDRVYGVDINPEAGQPDDRDKIIMCSQDHPGLALSIQGRGWAPFDLIVDDASHQAGPTAVTLANLWPLVAPDGAYVIEDWNLYEGAGIGQNIWQKIFGYWLAYPSADHIGQPHPYSGILDGIESVTIRQGLIVIRKGIPVK
jgi:hypothetical protein